jgi:hypothetical protein
MMLALLLTLSLCFGCADDRAESWIGQKFDDLIRAWGPPTASATLTDNTKIAEWSLDRNVGGGHRYPDGSGGTWTSRPINQHCKVVVEARGSDGVIIKAKVDGNLGGCNTLFRDKPAYRVQG